MLKKLLAIVAMLWYAAASFAAADVNTASAADLDAVKGVGPGLSARIVEERKKGAFKDWGDLISRVKGVGEKNAARFSASGMTVNGAAFAGAPAKAPRAKADKPAATSGNTIPPIATRPATPANPATPAAPAMPAPATK